MSHKSYFKRFLQYLRYRDEDNVIQKEIKQSLVEAADGDKKKKKSRKHKSKSYERKTEDDIKQKAKSDISEQMPELVIQIARLEMFIIVYLYHCPLNLIHLTWLLLTFLLSMENVFLISTYSMIPLLGYEFVFIYAMRIPIVNETWVMTTFGAYLQWEMQSRMYEQTFMFITLLTFIMMPSCLTTIHSRTSKTNGLLEFFKVRLNNPLYSQLLWVSVFFSLKHIQMLVLLFLFWNGI
jgi:hypothetical protein